MCWKEATEGCEEGGGEGDEDGGGDGGEVEFRQIYLANCMRGVEIGRIYLANCTRGVEISGIHLANCMRCVDIVRKKYQLYEAFLMPSLLMCRFLRLHFLEIERRLMQNAHFGLRGRTN